MHKISVDFFFNLQFSKRFRGFGYISFFRPGSVFEVGKTMQEGGGEVSMLRHRPYRTLNTEQYVGQCCKNYDILLCCGKENRDNYQSFSNTSNQ